MENAVLQSFSSEQVSKIEVKNGKVFVYFKDGSFMIIIGAVSITHSMEMDLTPVAAAEVVAKAPAKEETEDSEDDEDDDDEDSDDEDDAEDSDDEDDAEDDEEDAEDDDDEEEFYTEEEINAMDKKELLILIEDEELEVDPDDFPTTKKLRKAVIKALGL